MNALADLGAGKQATLEQAVDKALRMIPPVWPLESSVAVNPFVGQGHEPLAAAAARLGRIGAIPAVMPRDWYLHRIHSGAIATEDLAGALQASSHRDKPSSVQALIEAARQKEETDAPLPSVARLATDLSGTDWEALLSDRFGLWAGGHFDRGQALWSAPKQQSVWKAWRSWATHDLTPEIAGLKGFAAFASNLPDSPLEAIARSVHRLGLPEEALASYFHQLLMSLGGWAQYARHGLWKAELAGETDTTLSDFLAIRLSWEVALFNQHQEGLQQAWAEVRARHATPVQPSEAHILGEMLQEAAERASQRRLSATLAEAKPSARPARPLLQAAFCIDVRSEVFRRALEMLDPSIETLGFAGFFGLATQHRRFASDLEENRFPVLLKASVGSCCGNDDPDRAGKDAALRASLRAKRAWGRFRLAAVSSFAFVEAMGPAYVVKLLRGALCLDRPARPEDPAPRLSPDLDPGSRIDAAETILRAMSLTGGFARIVLLAGHGANIVNNPHASGLHCGACGGYSGEVNARLLAALLNDPAVRSGLAERGLAIPGDTRFVAALHDTTTDRVTLYDHDLPSPDHDSLNRIRSWLAQAGQIARGERQARLPSAREAKDLEIRARNWAETRPEWGLAGCSAFIAAPRHRTAGLTLEGRTFLHSYDWTQDRHQDFRVLELIMTAPVVVASWISLQYYGSSVAPEVFGSGNKLLHNVVGGIGVLEGNGGVLRAGLPFQSVHDGSGLVHEPLRLSVCIEAPREAMTEILSRHDTVRALFDNRWLHLFALDRSGQMAWRYAGGLSWNPVDRTGAEGPSFGAEARVNRPRPANGDAPQQSQVAAACP